MNSGHDHVRLSENEILIKCCTYTILLHVRKENGHIMKVLGQLYSREEGGMGKGEGRERGRGGGGDKQH